MSTPTVLIVTGNSNTGGAALKSLLDTHKGQVRIKAAYRDLAKAKDLDPSVEAVLLDSERPDTFAQAFAGVDKVLIVPPNAENRADIVSTLINAAKDHGVKHVVLISVPGTDEGKILFERQFQEMEASAKASGMAWTFLRCVFFAENVWGFQNSIKNDSKVYMNLGEGAIPLVSVSDIGRAAAAVLVARDKYANQAFNITGPQLLSGKDIAGAFAKHLARDVDFVAVPYEAVVSAFVGLGFPKWQSEGIAELIEKRYKPIDIPVSDAVERLTGVPPISLDTLVASIAGAFQ